jgi:hypothetical protein
MMTIPISLFNQKVWDANPDRAEDVICEALSTGGFGEDLINRRVGNYEGQVMAIRSGLVDKDGYNWRINDAGQEFLRKHGKAVAVFLPVIDSWHRSEGEFCMYETTYRGEPTLKFAKELIPQGAHLCMDPLFRKQDAEVLRDYLSAWLAKVA